MDNLYEIRSICEEIRKLDHKRFLLEESLSKKLHCFQNLAKKAELGKMLLESRVNFASFEPEKRKLAENIIEDYLMTIQSYVHGM